MTLRDSQPVVLVNSYCSCVAGCGMCNHLVALLYQTAHYSASGMSVVPPVLACTETEQKWHKPRSMGVNPGPVDAMVVRKAKPGATTASGIRSKLYKGYSGDLPVPSTLNPGPAYAEMAAECVPLICQMNISADKPLVNSIFGMVQAGSVLSYQHPPPAPDSVVIHEDAPPYPRLPLEGYHLQPTECSFVPTHQQCLHLSSLSVTLQQCHMIEEATRDQSATPEWHSLRRERVTASHFREVSHVKSGTAENLAERMIRGTRQTALMKRGLEMEGGALKDYAVLKNLNLIKCGFVVHPDAPWLGASSDGLVFDPLERPSFGLVEVKCPNAQSYVDCAFVRPDHGAHKLKESHSYYWQVQGQLLITGMQWCDFVVCAHEDMLVQRIYRDAAVLREMKIKTDLFFFYTYMSKYLSMCK